MSIVVDTSIVMGYLWGVSRKADNQPGATNMTDITIYVTTDATTDEYTAAQLIADDAGVACERGDHTYIEGGDAIEMSGLFAVLNSEMAIARGETD